MSELERSVLDPVALERTPLPDSLSDVSFPAQIAPRTKTLANDIVVYCG
jgi:hypothetical protein